MNKIHVFMWLIMESLIKTAGASPRPTVGVGLCARPFP